MDNLVFLIKSHAPHLNYTKQLVETTAEHNKDNIPVYLSIPKSQEHVFKNNIDTSLCNIIYDEDIIQGDINQNWFTQQLVKLDYQITIFGLTVIHISLKIFMYQILCMMILLPTRPCMKIKTYFNGWLLKEIC